MSLTKARQFGLFPHSLPNNLVELTETGQF